MTGERGQMSPGDATTDFDASAFQIRQALYLLNTCTLVQVTACTNNGGLTQVGTVDVHPLVNQVDGNKTATPHDVIYGVPYFRYQGGESAVIMDPKVGDIGLACFADHDISSVIATHKEANPGTSRRYAMSDALYLGAFLGGIPTQYVRFSADGIEIHSPTGILLSAPQIDMEAPVITANASTSITFTTPTFTINGDTVLNGGIAQGAGGSGGNVSLIGPVVATHDVTAAGKSMDNHEHNVIGVQGGSSTITSTPPL